MKITKIIKKKDNLYQILLSDNTSLSFYDDTIIHFNLLTNKDLNERKLLEITAYNNNVAAYYKALTYIKSKLRTKKEIVEKLKKLGYNSQTIQTVIDKLTVQKYLDDELYITSFIADQVNLTLKGPRKIVSELIKLGFNEELLGRYMANYSEDIWQERIEKIINKKIKSNHNLSQKMLISKLQVDLINLGYTKDQFNNLISTINYQDDSKIIEREVRKAYKKYFPKYSGKYLEMRIKRHLYSKGFTSDIIIDDYL